VGAGLAYAVFNGFHAATMNWQSFSQVTFAFRGHSAVAGAGCGVGDADRLIGGLAPGHPRGPPADCGGVAGTVRPSVPVVAARGGRPGGRCAVTAVRLIPRPGQRPALQIAAQPEISGLGSAAGLASISSLFHPAFMQISCGQSTVPK